jgi:hypothetical protein
MGEPDGRKMERRVFLGLIAALSTAIAVARADVATIGAAKDNTIFQNNVNNSLGAGQAISAGTSNQSSPRRGLIQFDIAGAIPAGSTIGSVQLTLFLNQVGSSAVTNPTIRLYRLANDWGEGTAGSATNGVSGIGQGFAAGEGDATWNARHFSTTTPQLWNSPGGDFAAIDSAALAIVGTTLNTPYIWGSTPNLVADVQNWLDNPASNFGWMLKNDEESTASTVRGFWTREATRTGQTAFMPQLQVTYTAVPEPAGVLLIAGCVTGVVRRRPSRHFR